MNAGPNATTFTLPPELFPTAVRASASGFAAATAKVGATLGIFVLPQVKAYFGVSGVLALMAGVSEASRRPEFDDKAWAMRDAFDGLIDLLQRKWGIGP